MTTGIPPGKLGRTESWDGMEVLGGLYSVTGRGNALLHDKKVRFKYKAKQTSGGPIVAKDALVVPVSFWPTSVTFLEPDVVAVAGKGQDISQENTVIEIWQLTIPEVRAVVDPQTGLSSLELHPLAVRSKTTVYDQALQGQDMVRGMVRLRGKPTSVLVHFYDSGDLWELDYGQAVYPQSPPPNDPYPIVKVLSATAGQSVPHVQGLADTQMLSMHGADHQTLGHMYFIWPNFQTQTSQGSAAPTPLTLYDTDRDGTIDWWERASEAQNAASGVLDESMYTEKFLRSVF